MTHTPGGPPTSPDNEVAYVYAAALVLGVYLATLIFTVRWLLFSDEGWKQREAISWSMVFVTTFIFVLTMGHSALDLKGVMDQVRLLVTSPGVKYSSPMWALICKCTFANLVALAADVVLVYRCYVVYGGSLPVITFPCLLWVAGLVCTGIQLYLQIAHIYHPKIGPYTWASVNMTIGPGIALIPFWGSSTALNVYCTTMLIKLIHQVSSGSETSVSTKQFHFIAKIIAESGFIFTSISLAHFVVWFGNDNFAIQIISVINVPLIGIAFNLILIRAAYGRTEYLGKKSTEVMSSIRFGTNNRLTMRDSETDPETLDLRTQTTASFGSPRNQ